MPSAFRRCTRSFGRGCVRWNGWRDDSACVSSPVPAAPILNFTVSFGADYHVEFNGDKYHVSI